MNSVQVAMLVFCVFYSTLTSTICISCANRNKFFLFSILHLHLFFFLSAIKLPLFSYYFLAILEYFKGSRIYLVCVLAYMSQWVQLGC